MRILIAGAGEVGTHLAKMLSGDNHDIVVIDVDGRKLDELAGDADLITIEGDSSDFSVLKKASVRKCDLFIAVAHEESSNIISGMLAKQLGAKKVIVRIDNNEYLDPKNKEIFINIGIDYLFYPEQLAADEVIDLLGHTSSTGYEDFADGKLALTIFKLDASSPLVGKKLYETNPSGNLMFRTVAITRNGRTLIPKGNDIFTDHDTLYVITEKSSVKRVLEFTGRNNIDIRNLMILGGSRIGTRIAAELQERVNIKLIEYNEEKAYRLAEQLDNTLIIHEDGRDLDAMTEEGIGSMDAFVAVTGRSETNILTAMLAKKMGVKKVIAEVENMNYISLAENMGIDTIINKKLITAGNLFRFTMNTDVQTIKLLTGTDAEVLEFIAKPNSAVTKNTIQELDFPNNAIIGGLVRGDSVTIAVGSSQINAYDRVVVFALPDAVDKVARLFN